MRIRFFFCIIILALTTTCGAAAKVSLPQPRHYVEDYSNVIDADYERSLNGVLQELEQKTTAQVIVLTILTTQGIPIEQYAIELAEQWQLGQKGKDNGLLFMLATQDGRYRFEVGYGLEGFITDQYAARLGRDILVPYLKNGQFGQGIYETGLRIAQRIASESGVQLSGMPKLQQLPQQRRGIPCCGGILPFLFFFLILATRGRILFWMLPFMILGNRGMFSSGGSFGGGSFGGGFGSFGGGGGGGFGGGGAGGSW